MSAPEPEAFNMAVARIAIRGFSVSWNLPLTMQESLTSNGRKLANG